MSDSSADREIVNRRTIAASRARILEAFREPAQLAAWWGPGGFRNTFHEFNFQPGGVWRFDMHGPDGTDYPNVCVFEEVGPERIVLRHLESVHEFRLTVRLEEGNGGTHVTWSMVFEDAEECERVRPYVPRCNEENFDRLEAVVAGMG